MNLKNYFCTLKASSSLMLTFWTECAIDINIGYESMPHNWIAKCYFFYCIVEILRERLFWHFFSPICFMKTSFIHNQKTISFRFYFVIALRSLQGRYPVYPMRYTPYRKGRNRLILIRSYRCCYLRGGVARAPVVTRPSSLISIYFKVGFEFSRGPWIRFHFTIWHASVQTTIQIT